MADEPERLDAPNQQVVGGAHPSEEGTGGPGAEKTPKEEKKTTKKAAAKD